MTLYKQELSLHPSGKVARKVQLRLSFLFCRSLIARMNVFFGIPVVFRFCMLGGFWSLSSEPFTLVNHDHCWFFTGGGAKYSPCCPGALRMLSSAHCADTAGAGRTPAGSQVTVDGSLGCPPTIPQPHRESIRDLCHGCASHFLPQKGRFSYVKMLGFAKGSFSNTGIEGHERHVKR